MTNTQADQELLNITPRGGCQINVHSPIFQHISLYTSQLDSQ